MKRVLLCTGIAAALLTACSQTEDELMQPAQQEIALSVVNQTITKAPVNGTTFPTDLSIYVSAWNSVSKDYFKNVEFSKDASGTTWKAGQLWPINGITSFLAYAFNPASNSVMNENTAVWGVSDQDWAKSVSFAFVDDSSSPSAEKTLYHSAASGGAVKICTATAPTIPEQQEGTPYVDLLYANADQTKEKNYQTVDMEFKHSGAWIVFHVKLGTDISANNATLKINTFKLLNVHTGGTLNIDNKVVGGAKAAWDFGTIAAADYGVESFAAFDVAYNKTYAFGAILPEQQQTAIQFNYTLSSSNSAFTAQTATYTHNLDRFNKWEMGKKYVYNITISFSEIEIKPSVTEWDTTAPAGDKTVEVK